MYQTGKGLKFTEQDIFNEGCIPSTAQSTVVDITFSSKTIAGIIGDIMAFFDVPEEHLQLNACDEIGRIDVSVMETEESIQASKSDIKQWKEDKKRLWNSIYTYHVVLTTSISVAI